jgi:hypothetical protein
MSPRGSQRSCFLLFSQLLGQKRDGPALRAPLGMWSLGLTQTELCVTPKWEKESCCHGGLGEFLRGEVRDIYTQGQAESGQTAEGRGVGLNRTQQGRGVQAGGTEACPTISLCVVSPPVEEAFYVPARVGVGNLGPAVGRWRIVGDPCGLCVLLSLLHHCVTLLFGDTVP